MAQKDEGVEWNLSEPAWGADSALRDPNL